MTTAPPSPGKILTFYSYKGGTGRTMALANAAWILACNGKRVLVIDWDLEAPGLHRYFRPFLADPELAETPGLIDFFVNFVEASQIEARSPGASGDTESPWFYRWADLTRYAEQLDYEFPKGGALDFVGAGRQGPTYGARVNSFVWSDFYEKLGGGVFLEATKEIIRPDYDYILIDSRTGLSDTSGICTVQMPDELVVCFTLNRQSIEGAAATARSADGMRRLPSGRPGLKVWPVPTRVDPFEKERLEAARNAAHQKFAEFLWHVPAGERLAYWGRMEIRYFPYYAYEEILATIADPPQHTTSLLDDFERLAGTISGIAGIRMPGLGHGVRESLVAKYETPVQPSARIPKIFISYSRAAFDSTRIPKIFISYSRAAFDEAKAVAGALEAILGEDQVFWDMKIPLGSVWTDVISKRLKEASIVLIIAGPDWASAGSWQQEVEWALAERNIMIPVLVGMVGTPPSPLAHLKGFEFDSGTLQHNVNRLVRELHPLINSAHAGSAVQPDPDDPQKGQFGGLNERNGRRLSACIEPLDDGWCSVTLSVERMDPKSAALERNVVFHLHPTFRASVKTVKVRESKATLRLSAWGAFTVGAIADEGATRLELDLATLPDAPKEFRER